MNNITAKPVVDKIINRLKISNDSFRVFIMRLILYVVIAYPFHRYLLQYGHAEFLKREYQATPLSWQLGKYIFLIIAVLLFYAVSTFHVKITRAILIVTLSLLLIFLINVFSTLIYKEYITDEFEYQLIALLLVPVLFIDNKQLDFIKQDLSGSLMNNIQWIIIISNIYVVISYFTTGRLPFHAFEGIIIRFGGLWDDPNSLAIFSVFLFVYAIIRKQYFAAMFHIINVILALSFTGFILLIAGIFYVSYRRFSKIKIVFFFGIAVISGITLIIIFNDAILQFYELKRLSVEQHSTIEEVFYPLPLMQPMIFHETWWISILYNYPPFAYIFIAYCTLFVFNAYFNHEESIQKFYFILFIMASMFLPFLYMFPLNFILILFLFLSLKRIAF